MDKEEIEAQLRRLDEAIRGFAAFRQQVLGFRYAAWSFMSLIVVVFSFILNEKNEDFREVQRTVSDLRMKVAVMNSRQSVKKTKRGKEAWNLTP
ncbi:hypothetical protein [Candidatus Venteria ishoeyi]|uniref:Uncharacterized protein n=1 Tax=Candidatus Venteria ishoeyi TaxID=1899563 RepID=A0A1H6FA58_9GAMM|nr:hypothetical protein [Candidatus Venteria ishoeyi]SEH06503.1 Uncharacterised protein [Candidatus Venteria ishoeyi]